MRRSRILFCLLAIALSPLFNLSYLSARESETLVALSKRALEAKDSAEIYSTFEELKTFYFKDNRYADFIEFLKSLAKKKKPLLAFVNYYTALCRYSQLKYLEEAQKWDEYFSQGNAYRNEITDNAAAAISATFAKEPVYLYSRLLLWQFHKDQQDAFIDGALSDLMLALSEYSRQSEEPAPVKSVAERLAAYGEKGKSKEAYKIYVNKIASQQVSSEELFNIAEGFYREDSLDLSELVFDVYIERISGLDKEKQLPILIDIARKFTYKDEGPKDMFYAEKIFGKIEETAGIAAFDQVLIYLRGFNLEKLKEFAGSEKVYTKLLEMYPAHPKADEINYKLGIISAYIMRDLNKGRAYFEKLAAKEEPTSHVISSLYQLGLLSQWSNDTAKAREHYNKLIEMAKDSFKEAVSLTKERIEELDAGKPMEYNLKTFLDTALSEEYAGFDMSKSELKASRYRLGSSKEVTVSSNVFLPESGCMQVEVQYLWSGDLGKASAQAGASSFNTSYTEPGTKIISLIIVSAQGIIDRNLDLLDVN
ncbi:MAG: hypothetical protein AB1481_03325 [Candidatus Omnitrophota bacterium]